jgi:hypothetical protein
VGPRAQEEGEGVGMLRRRLYGYSSPKWNVQQALYAGLLAQETEEGRRRVATIHKVVGRIKKRTDVSIDL